MSTTSTGDKDPNDETVIDTGNGAIENAEENARKHTRKQKTTQYRQLTIIKKATDRRNGARTPKSKEINRATTARAPVGVRERA